LTAATIDNNVGLVRIAPGRIRFTLQLWRVRPLTRFILARRWPGDGPAKVPAHPIHDPNRRSAST
jgi:hypothetical protein